MTDNLSCWIISVHKLGIINAHYRR